VALNYANLDEETRNLALAEMEADVRQGTFYHSPRLSQTGQQHYEGLLREALENHNDGWLASQLRQLGCLSSHESRRTPRGGTTIAKVPINAADMLAEGEFNRYYCRGLCQRALEVGIEEVEVYRAKAVTTPRPESQRLIGRRLSARSLLNDLRTSQGVEPALGVPPGPNSGLSVRLPED
jgi:hypothetical protein